MTDFEMVDGALRNRCTRCQPDAEGRRRARRARPVHHQEERRRRMTAAAIVNPKLAAASFGKTIQPLLQAGTICAARVPPRRLFVPVPRRGSGLHAHGRPSRLRATVRLSVPPGGWVVDRFIRRASVARPGQLPSGNGFHCRTGRTAPGRQSGSTSRDGGSITTIGSTKDRGLPSEKGQGTPSQLMLQLQRRAEQD